MKNIKCIVKYKYKYKYKGKLMLKFISIAVLSASLYAGCPAGSMQLSPSPNLVCMDMATNKVIKFDANDKRIGNTKAEKQNEADMNSAINSIYGNIKKDRERELADRAKAKPDDILGEMKKVEKLLGQQVKELEDSGIDLSCPGRQKGQGHVYGPEKRKHVKSWYDPGGKKNRHLYEFSKTCKYCGTVSKQRLER